MTTLSSTARNFHTFHANTAAVPTEITTQIVKYVIADAQPLPLGGGTPKHRAQHPYHQCYNVYVRFMTNTIIQPP